jgi:hypothetical protein
MGTKLLLIPSFVDFMGMSYALIQMFISPVPFHKDRDGKLRAGPVWDFNLSLAVHASKRRQSS